MKTLLLLLGLCLIPGAVRAQAEDKVATASGIDSSFAQEIDLTKNYDETAAKMATEPEKFLGLSDGLFAGGSVFLGLGPRVVRVPVNVNP
jgi:hypothetical protein